ncbi:FtsX-like permease family protein [Oceanirhabdus seepicola]|uniref:ABC transporter permease n=1 Tax=Oceanirhabdus seepicola TaxID=2828781 RepID=A0A9J6PAB8_9CLOT|nr:ABC transporter permease [Oceanirhabdus seepicola]MCM1992317.1 ABC transporter permease [Oceanirhabdus seepicola]
MYLDNNKSFKNRKILYSNSVRSKSIVITTVAIIALISLLIFICDAMVLDKIKHVESIYGKYHIEIRDINSKELEIIKSNNNIDKIGVVDKYSDNIISEKYIVARIGYYDEISRELLNIELIDGYYPRKKKEIAFEQWVLEHLDTEKQKNIRDYVTLGDSNLNNNDYLSDLPDYYQIVGLLNNTSHKKDTKLTVGLVSKEQTYKIAPSKKKYDVYIKFDDIKKIDTIVEDLIRYNYISEKKIFYNVNYINELENMKIIEAYKVLIALIIILAATLILNNIYVNFNYDRVRYIGILRAIGCTKKQLYEMITLEIILINLKAIFIGMILGIIAYIPVIEILKIYGIYLPINAVNISNIILVGICSVILIITIAVMNIIRIDKMNIFDMLTINSNIKYIKDITYNKFWYSIIQKVGITTQLSIKNLWSNPKKIKKGIIFISTAFVFFIVVNSIIQNSPYGMGNLNKWNTDIIIRTDEIELTSFDYEELSKIKGVKDISSFQNLEVYVNISEDDQKNRVTYQIDEKTYLRSVAIGFEKNIFKNVKKKIGRTVMEELSRQRKVVVNEAFAQKYPELMVGDSIEISFPFLDIAEIKYKPINFEVIGIVSYDDTEFEYDKTKPYIFIHKYIISQLLDYRFYSQFNIDFADGYSLNEKQKILLEINDITNKKDGVTVSTSYEEKYKNYQRNTIIITIIIVFIITLISALSIISSSNQLIMNRARELSIYRIVGMTKKQLKRMVILEGFYLGLISSSIGTIIGGGIVYIIKTNSNIIDEIPYGLIAILFIGVNLMSIISGALSLKSIERKNLAEFIRMIK